MAGLFDTFGIAKRGLFAQQKALDVTSHNVANANTEGYSRQRVTLQTTTPYCTPSFNSAAGPGQLGTGVEVTSIDRVRDSFLDYQTRVETGVQGRYAGRDKFLSQIENILNEPSDTGISSLVGKFFDDWQQLSKQAETSNARSVVVQQSLALTNELNHTSTELEKLKENTQINIKDDVFDINTTLSQINDLNKEIVQVKVAGQSPNDLEDKRDLLLDQLSAKFGITIDKKNYDGIDVTTTNDPVDSASPNGGAAPIDPVTGKPMNIMQTINPDNAIQFAYISNIDTTSSATSTTVTYYVKGDMSSDSNKRTITFDPPLTAAQLQKFDECRVLYTDAQGNVLTVDGANNKTTDGDAANWVGSNLTINDANKIKLFQPPSGELKGYMSVQQDVDVYQDQLNKLAKAFAFAVNAVETQSDTWSADGSYSSGTNVLNFFVNSDTAGTEDNITAANITVNQALVDDPMKVIAGLDADVNVSGESDGSRALAIAQLRDKLMGIQNIDSTTTRQQFLTKTAAGDLFAVDTNLGNGLKTAVNNLDGMTLDNYFKDTVDRLGIQEQEAKRMVSNQDTLLSGIKQAKDSSSGVSLDEEMANLVQFQHAYQANAKIISTVDQLLDVVVNGLIK
ncbi:MAG: flgK [Clostridiaceae bacterium]|nr:flgK [Clostridiaceae bacterium]